MNIKKLMKNKKGFTLIEIIVVVVILAVLMAVAVPSVMKYMNEADDAKYLAQARGAMIVAQTESAKAWIEAAPASKPVEWVANSTTNDAILGDITGDPKITSIKAAISDKGAVTSVEVVLEGGKTATITPNGKVELKPTTTP